MLGEELWLLYRIVLCLVLLTSSYAHPLSSHTLPDHGTETSIFNGDSSQEEVRTTAAYTSSKTEHDVLSISQTGSDFFFSKGLADMSLRENPSGKNTWGVSTHNLRSERFPPDDMIYLDVTSRVVEEESKPRRKTKPFFVKIDEERFYGGLITYSHKQHPSQICRVMNACVRQDGTLVLPEWMRRHDTILSFHCGQTRLEFSLPDSKRPPSLMQADLIGITRPRPSMPDFLKDFIPSAVVFDLVYGDHQASKTCHSRKGKDCEPFPGLAQDFKPVVQLHSRLEDLDPKQSWVQQFVKLMRPPNTGRQPKIVYDLDEDDGTDASMHCFRSAFFTRGPYNKTLITKGHLNQIHFLKSNGIKKKARVFRSTRGDTENEAACNLNITLSNRKLVDGAHNRLIGRYVMNIPALRKAIIKQARRIPGLKVNVETMTLEGRSLWWQINGMQKTDIWVAGHGSLLTNMLFLRENSTVIEIQPFAYYPQTYEMMAAHMAHVQYERYIAHPDKEAFETCIRHMYPKKHASFQRAELMIEKFSKAAEKYFQSDSTHSLTLQNFNETGLLHVRNCAKMQRLDTNTKNFAITVIRQARLLCGLPRPNSSL